MGIWYNYEEDNYNDIIMVINGSLLGYSTRADLFT
jgi:hypothetical protein